MAEVTGAGVVKQIRASIDAQHRVQQAARDAAAEARPPAPPAQPAEVKR